MRSAEERAAKDGNKSDRMDARKLAELLRRNKLSRSTTARPACAAAGTGPQLSDHRQRSDAGDESSQSDISELGDSLCRPEVYYPRHRAEWLRKIREAGVRRRAEQLYQQLDMLQ